VAVSGGCGRAGCRCGDPTVTVDVSLVTTPDLTTIGVLALLQLAAARRGARIELSGASGPLRELVCFTGLGGVLAVEARRQAEEREQCAVEEVGEPHDPPV
jgi:hypothetical protein